MKNVTKSGKKPLPPGERVRELRERIGYTQEELAEKLPPDSHGRPRSEKTIGRIERGDAPLSGKYAIMLSRVLNCRPQYLLGEDEFITEGDKLSYILDKAEDNARALHQLIKGIASNYDYQIIMLSADENDSVDLGGDYCYAIVHEEKIIAFISLEEYTQLRSEIAHYSAFLFGKLLDKAKKRQIAPFPVPNGGNNHG